MENRQPYSRVVHQRDVSKDEPMLVQECQPRKSLLLQPSKARRASARLAVGLQRKPDVGPTS